MKASHVKISKIVIDEKSQDFKDQEYVCSGSIIPGDDKENSIPLVFDSDSNLTLTEHFTFPYGDKSKSALSLIVKRVKKIDEKNTNYSEFCRVTLPLNWFQKNAVTDEVFPLTDISKKAKIGEIHTKIHKTIKITKKIHAFCRQNLQKCLKQRRKFRLLQKSVNFP